MTSTTQTPEQGAPDASPTIAVSITPTVERDLQRRGVFPELRRANAARISSTNAAVHRLSVERAKELLDDAQKMYLHARDLPRGTLAAYTALARNLTGDIKRMSRDGLLDDPGIEGAKRLAEDSPARFKAGERICYEEYGYTFDGTIVGGYQMYSVVDDEGPYVQADGRRKSYRYGYLVKVSDGGEYFMLAHQLRRDNDTPSHLCLVASRTTTERRA
jgi:hypothetical protein